MKRLLVFGTVALLCGGGAAARADTLLTYVGQKLDRSGCSGPCTFTHVHFSVRIPGRVKPNQTVSFCGGNFCAAGTADPVTYSDGQSVLTLKTYTWFEFGGSVTMDAAGTGVTSFNLDSAEFHQSRPRIVAYGAEQATGDFIGGQFKKMGFNVSSKGPGVWTVSTIH